MIVIDTTYRTRENKEQIDGIMGKPFSFMETLKLKGKGSSRMIIDEVSVGLKRYLSSASDISYGSIELRPKGILVVFSAERKFYSWLVPYYRLYIYKTKGLSVHGEGQFVRFRDDRMMSENKEFFKKLIDKKAEYDVNFPSTGNGQLSRFEEL